MILPPFRLHRPRTVSDAVGLAADLAGEGVDFVAGGTDLLQNYKNRLNAKPQVVSVLGIPGLGEVGEGGVGALATLSEVAGDARVRRSWTALAEAAGVVASPLVRNTATLGGNLLVDNRCYFFNQSAFWRTARGPCLKAEGDECLVVPQPETCWAAFSSDTGPALVALGADIRLAGPEGEREVAAADFWHHDGIARNRKAPGELVLGVSIPEAPGTRSGYEKLRWRAGFDYPALGVAAALAVADDGSVTSLSVCLGAVHTEPVVVDSASAVGSPLDESAIQDLADRAEAAAQPKRTMGIPPAYRKRMAGVFTRRLLTRLAA